MITRSLSLLSVSLLAVLATACGDDGGNNNGTCGDSHVTGSEQCDDGNTTNGDGCSQSCQTEGTNPVCGDNTVDVATEQCDDGNTTSGDGCSATCQNETPMNCGNGAINGTEACDDGDTMGGDGCSATCTVETGYTCTGTPSVCTMVATANGTCATPFNVMFTGTTTMTATLTGDTTTSTSQVGEADCDGFPMEGGGKDHIYKFTTTDVRDVEIEIDPATMSGAIVRLMRAPCDLTMEIPEFTGAADGCADLDGSGFLGYTNLAAGTYYIVVDGYDDTVDGAYTINVNATMPGCGNGMVNPVFEFCDDGNTTMGDGCNMNCETEMGYSCTVPTPPGPSVCEMIGCGDGELQTGETCDDDNVTAGDGCSATCLIETGWICNDAEPSVCVMAGCGNGIVETATEACDDGDMMAGDGCDATCQVETGWICDGADPTVCVMAGCGNGIVEDATEECDDGNLVAGDRCDATCLLESDVAEAAEPNDTVPQALSAGNHIIRGTYQTGDVDLYTFTLTATSKVEIETYFTINGTPLDYGGVGANTLFDCVAEDDTMLGVFAAGVDVTMDTLAMARDSDEGDAFCSYIGPRDGVDMDYEATATPDTTQLAMLPAGTYTIKLSVDTLPGTDPVTLRRYLMDLKITPMGSAVAPVAGDLKINEVLADDSTTNDSNCDGSTTGTNDEFVELVNVSANTLDLTGVTIADPNATVFTFATQASGSLTLAPGKAVVVWAGGAPACPGVTNFFVGSMSTLSLNNAGDTITVATGGATPVTIATATWGQSTAGVSWNLMPDVTGTAYALHTAVMAGANSSAGKKADGTAF